MRTVSGLFKPSSQQDVLSTTIGMTGPVSRSSQRILARHFASSTVRQAEHTHYETLGVPRTASRMEIKANYFRLSKKYHPDVNPNKEPESMQQFHRVSEAYHVLGNDRERRAYDRTLSQVQSTHPHPGRGSSHAPGTGEATRHAYEIHERRRRGASHAWEGPRSYRTNPTSHGHAHGRARPSAGGHYDPTARPQASSTASASSPNVRRGADAVRSAETPLRGRVARAEAEARAHDRIVNESGLMRFLSTVGVLVIVGWIGGIGGKG